MNSTRQIILFGVRSPLVVEYEETCRRAGVDIMFGISCGGAPRATTPLIVELHELAPHHLSVPCIVCAFSATRRQGLAALAKEAGFVFADALIDPTATVAGTVHIGRGTYINAGCVIGSQSMLGDHVLFNRSSSAGHHTMLADCVSVGPGVTLAGNVRVGEASTIGAGSVVLPDVRIGARAIVAAGSVVRKHVADDAFVAGNPATERPFDPMKSSLNLPDAE